MIGVILLILFTLVLGWILIKALTPSKESSKLPPMVQPSIPLLGNALEYKKSPPGFLIEAARKYGSVFRINLAGMETTVVTSRNTMKQFAQAPESVLSAREAVSDFGFLNALGEANTTRGTDFHRYVIKNRYFKASAVAAKSSETLSLLAEAIDAEIALVLAAPASCRAESGAGAKGVIPDFMYFSRRVFLTLNIVDFMGRDLLDQYNAQGNCFSFSLL